MKTYHVLLVAPLLFVALVCFGEEKKIQRSDLPPAVEQALQRQLAGATVKGFTTEHEGGKVLYEAELMVEGHSKDILFDANGRVQEVEEEVAFDSLPVEVKAGLRAGSKGGKIAKVESLTRQDNLVAYEAVVERNGKKSEIQVGPKGEKLDHEV
jgi:hypothetical protein